jgi:hypothetical protein
MSVPGKQEMSLRPGRFEHKRLAWALAISLAFHLFCFGGYEFTRTILPGWLQHIKFLAALAQELRPKPTPPPRPLQPTEAPLVFVDVDPATATAEAPKDAKYYSAHNTKAANPEADKDSDIPKITGQVPDISKTESAPRAPEKLQPNLPHPEQPEQIAKPKPPPGDLAMAKPEITLKPEPPGKDETTRPRTLAEARRRHPSPGDKMKLDGGVNHRAPASSLDTKSTVTGDYDTQLYEAISQRWWDLLDTRANTLVGGSGQVYIHFKLHSDGRITELTIETNTTSNTTLGWLCYQAIQDVSTPVFQKWPDEMRRVQNDPRFIQFVFTYY